MADGDVAEAWIRAHVESVAAAEVVHVRPWGTVRRVPIARGGVAWFKECAPVQAFEPRLTAALAARHPELLPEVLAHDDARGWLLLGDAGAPIGFDRGPEPWLPVLTRYAQLQREEAARATEHLAAGVPDRRLERFPELYEDLLARELPLRSDDLRRLRAFAPRLAELCGALAAGGPQETIQHDDLHGANVYERDGGVRILDWGDSCVSHPFLTVYVTFVHLDEASERWLACLRDAYLEPWGRPKELRQRFDVAVRVGPFAHLFKELHVLDATPEEQRCRFAPDLPRLLADCVAATEIPPGFERPC